MKLRLYSLLVNRSPAVKRRYESFVNAHKRLHACFPAVSWVYLILLNIKYVILQVPDIPAVKAGNESGSFAVSAEEISEQLCRSDVVSFDIFDTLIIRPFSKPEDLFYIVGEKLGVPDFRRLRMEAERAARAEKAAKGHGTETDIYEIYAVLYRMTGICTETGIEAELQTEHQLCRANPFMKKVFDNVKAAGKTIIISSDMYLPRSFILQLLEKNGFNGFSELYLSNETGCGKWDGGLYSLICSDHSGKSIAHIGDNTFSDVQNAKKHGLSPFHYPNVNRSGEKFRPRNMSPITGSAYSGIVNSTLYTERYSPAFEYGFKCGGLLILGFCGFIHEHSLRFGADKILFLSRDGYIVKKVYDMLYPEDKTEYVYWSRAAAAKLCADIFPQEYVRRFIVQKSEKGFTIGEILRSMGISGISLPFDPAEKLTRKNMEKLISEIHLHMPEICSCLKTIRQGAERYFREILKNCRRAVTVDCGWAGSGNIMLEAFVRRTMGADIAFKGLLAGSNSANQDDSDFSETYFKTDRLAAYCFSSDTNRNFYEFHYPAKKHNVFFELLFGAPCPSCTGFDENGPVFDNEAENSELINEIHNGELEFIRRYLDIFGNIPYMLKISGSDAYAPFAAALSDGGDHLRGIFRSAVFDELADGRKEKV